MHRKHYAPTTLRNFVFGVEDSLVSTVGLLSGIAVGGVPKGTILMTGIILIAVEAISMAVGSFLAEDVAEEAKENKSADIVARDGAIVMFVSYILAGFIPLFPYFFSTSNYTVVYSIGLTFVGLAVLGIMSGKLFSVSIVKSTFRILLLGGFAVAVGVGVGRLIPTTL